MAESEESGSFFLSLVREIVQSPVNIALICIISYLVYKIYKSRQPQEAPPPPVPALPKIRRDFTVAELKEFDGKQGNGRVLLALNGVVYDVTKAKRFYGPNGPYAAFGGRDASRGLATFSLVCVSDEYDDLSDLNKMEMDSVLEWEAQFKEKYDVVGRLLRDGEEHRNYSDEEEEPSDQSLDKAKDD